MKKRILCAAIIMAICLCGGCGNLSDTSKPAATIKGDIPPTQLVYYTIGTEDSDLQIVNDELNKLLLKKMNAQVEYKKIAWDQYGDRVGTMINSGVNFDIAFASGISKGGFAGNAKKGAWLELTPYLQTTAKELYDIVDPLFWKGIQVNKKIFGVPTNKELAVPLMFAYPESLIDKYDIDISQYKSIQSLKPILKLIKDNEPEYVGLKLDGVAHNFFAIDGYEFVLSQDIPLMVKSTDDELKVVNIYETDECKSLLRSLREYFQSGYINEDAAVIGSQSLIQNEKVFAFIAEGGPYSDVSWSGTRGYKVVSQQVTDSVVTTESTQGGIMAINAKSQHPKESIEFITILNTDKEVRNLLNFGIEGKHYNLTKTQQVERISDGYMGVAYTQGNWFILKTVVGEPLNKWEQFAEFNNKAVQSELLGFNPSTVQLEKEVEAVRSVFRKYYPFLMTGSVDTDYFLPVFNAKLKEAGIDHLRNMLQIQINTWKKQ